MIYNVYDQTATEEEGRDYPVFSGTHDECQEWVAQQGFGYEILPEAIHSLTRQQHDELRELKARRKETSVEKIFLSMEEAQLQQDFNESRCAEFKTNVPDGKYKVREFDIEVKDGYGYLGGLEVTSDRSPVIEHEQLTEAQKAELVLAQAMKPFSRTLYEKGVVPSKHPNKRNPDKIAARRAAAKRARKARRK